MSELPEEKDYRGIIAILVVVGYMILATVMIFKDWPVQDILAFLGTVGTVLGTVIGYYFGSKAVK